MLHSFRTYRILSATVVLTFLVSLLVPVVQHVCAMGGMEIGAKECCCDEMAMPMSMPSESGCEGQHSGADHGSDHLECCTVSMETAPAESTMLPVPVEAPAVWAVSPPAYAQAEVLFVSATPTRTLSHVLPPGDPPARILYSTFLN